MDQTEFRLSRKTGKLLCLIPLFWACFVSVTLAHEELNLRLAEVNTAIGQNPQNPLLYLNRGELYREHGSFAEARADFENAAKLGNDLDLAYFHLGRMLLYQGDLNGAEENLLVYLQRSGDNDQNLRVRKAAVANLAMTYQKQGRYLDEADQYTRVIQASEQPAPGFYVSRARAYVAAGDPYLEQAQVGLYEGIEKLGPQTELLDYAVELELRRGDVDSALAQLDALTETANRKERHLFQRGQILEQAGRQQEAIDAYRQALQATASLSTSRLQAPSTQKLKAGIEVAIARLARDS